MTFAAPRPGRVLGLIEGDPVVGLLVLILVVLLVVVLVRR